MEIKLTDEEAQRLLLLSKEILEQHNIKLEEKCKGDIVISSSKEKSQFILNYFIRPGKSTLNFRESQYNLCLLRINLNDGFHKNSNKQIIRGNRINVFSEKEYKSKNDSSTHMIAYPLPYEIFENSSDFVKQLFTMLEYTKTKHNDNIYIETNLQLRWWYHAWQGN